jgi:hypothetical protein
MSSRSLFPCFEAWFQHTRRSSPHGRRYMDFEPDSNGGWVVFMAFRYGYNLGRKEEKVKHDLRTQE